MIFGEMPLDQAEGALLAHSIKLGSVTFKKGRVLSAQDIEALRAHDWHQVTAARLEPGDVPEDQAATAIATVLRGTGLDLSAAFTGRCNLIVKQRGLLVVDRERLDAVNLVDEAMTVATLAPFELVEARQMAATIKIIPFAVADGVLQRVLDLAASTENPVIRIAPLRPRQVGLVQTILPGFKKSLLEKTLAVVNGRLAALDCPAVLERRCDHRAAAVADAIAELRAADCELIIVSGASAIVDRKDVVPSGVEAAGGVIDHFGMPVDPGNLLLLAHQDETPILGMPSCARSPKLNGFDWVLQRLLADLPVVARDIMSMGAGGLLKEIASRPLPRAQAVTPAAKQGAEPPRARRIASIVLAAGQSRRMGPRNKLLAEVDGKAMVRRVVETALASQAEPLVVVTGHESEKVTAALADLPVTLTHNPDFAAGLSSSLHRGLAALSDEVDGALVCLADMPFVDAAVLDRLIAAFNPIEGRAICLPTWRGKRGNPVLFGRQFFAEMQSITGDLGARQLIGDYAELVAEISMPDDAVLQDFDTPEALARVKAADTGEAEG